MRTHPRKLSDKPSGREATLQMRTAENWPDMLVLCAGEKNGEEKAGELALSIFNGNFAVKFFSAHRDVLGKAKKEDLPAVIAGLQAAASESWMFEGRGERKPSEPREVVVQEQKSYSKAELDAILAQVGAKAKTAA